MKTQILAEEDLSFIIKESTKVELKARLISLKEYIDLVHNREVTLKELGDQVAICPSYMLRIFKRYFKITPYQYVVYKRIEDAKRILTVTQSVTETCKLVGYRDLAPFSKLFKKHTGICPRDYIKQAATIPHGIMRANESFEKSFM